MSQYSLFNSIDKKVKETKNNLVISAKDSTEKNNKKTIEIDKKIRKIEQLKEQIKKINNTVAIAKKLYDKL
jgi:heterodisulfide reductase subunit C